MTREEAKEILTHNWTRVDNPNYSESELDEAFFMAIEALETQYNCIICPRCGKVFSELDGRKGGDAEINETKSPYMQPSPKGEDLINREDAIEAVEKEKAIDPFGRYDKQNIGIDWALDALKALPSAEAVQRWIPFTRRPMTEEEQKDYPNCTFMFDCVLPDDGDEILVSNGRFVWMDTFCNDVDGCYLDRGDDIDEDMAWMPLPTPYKGGDSE